MFCVTPDRTHCLRIKTDEGYMRLDTCNVYGEDMIKPADPIALYEVEIYARPINAQQAEK